MTLSPGVPAAAVAAPAPAPAAAPAPDRTGGSGAWNRCNGPEQLPPSLWRLSACRATSDTAPQRQTGSRYGAGSGVHQGSALFPVFFALLVNGRCFVCVVVVNAECGGVE